MKRRKLTICLFMCLLLFAFVVAASSTSFAEETLKGTVIKVYRDSYLVDYETGKEIKVRDGLRLTKGDKLKTGPKSSVILELNYDLIKVGPNTEVEISDLSSSEEEIEGKMRKKTSIVLKILFGKIYASVKDLSEGSVFEVHTDISVAGVRGTDFSSEYLATPETEKGKEMNVIDTTPYGYGDLPFSTIMNLRGSIDFGSIDEKGNPIGSTVRVESKKKSTITSGNPPTDPEWMKNDEIKALTTAIEQMTKTLEKSRFSGSGGGSSSGGSSVCFAPDTLVLMADKSLKKIRDVVKGDSVMGYDFDLGESVTVEVLEAAASPHENIYLLNGKIEVTGQHPFYPKANKPVKIKDFPGDVKTVLGDTDGDTNTLEEIAVESLKEIEPGELYYDLKFEKIHTYFVSDGSGNLYLVRECD